MIYTIKAVETGAGVYYTLCDSAGYPVAQGRQAFVDCVHESMKRGDTPRQLMERLRFRNLDLVDTGREPQWRGSARS